MSWGLGLYRHKAPKYLAYHSVQPRHMSLQAFMLSLLLFFSGIRSPYLSGKQ